MATMNLYGEGHPARERAMDRAHQRLAELQDEEAVRVFHFLGDRVFAEIDLLAALSACPGGDCGGEHSSDAAACHPLKVEVHRPRAEALAGWQAPARNGYAGGHGV